MGKINTGMERGRLLEIKKTVGGVAVAGYPKTLNFCAAFGELNGITDVELEEMATEAYRERFVAFAAYVLATERMQLNESDAYRENLTGCPI